MGTGKTKTYTLVDADAGKQVRVRLRFRDLGNNLEQLESAARPRYGRVMWPAADAVAAACATPEDVANGTEELIWTAEVTVGTGTRAGITSPYGYSLLGGGFGFGDLTDHDFRFGNDNYTVDILIAHSDGLHFGLTSDLPPATAAGLVLHVCDEAFELRHSPGDSINYGSTSFDYSWGNDFPDWSGHSTRRVWLTRADTTAPMLLPQPDGVVVEGAALTLTFDEALDAGSEPAKDEFTLAVARPGAAAPAVAGVALAGGEAVLTLDGPVLHGDIVTLAYAAPTAKPLQDPAGNDVAGFTRTAHNVTPEGPRVVSVAFVVQPESIGNAMDDGYDGVIECSSFVWLPRGPCRARRRKPPKFFRPAIDDRRGRSPAEANDPVDRCRSRTMPTGSPFSVSLMKTRSPQAT